MQQIKNGDVVQLKSGGPRMTVSGLDGTGANCTWFIGEKLESGYFELATLNVVPAREAAGRVHDVHSENWR